MGNGPRRILSRCPASILNLCSAFSSKWFPLRERNMSTMIGETVPANLGAAIVTYAVGSATNTPLVPYFTGIAAAGTGFMLFYTFTFRVRPCVVCGGADCPRKGRPCRWTTRR